MKYAALLGLVFLATGCGGGDTAPPLPPGPLLDGSAFGTGGGSGGLGLDGGPGGLDGSADAETEGGENDAGPDSGTDAPPPIVSITSPVTTTDPGSGAVLVATSTVPAVVLCTAKKASATAPPVDPASVTIEMDDGNGATVKSVVATPTTNADEYSASFDVTTLANGVVTFQCSASEGGASPHAGTSRVTTLVDNGPTVVLKSPKDNGAFSATKPAEFSFTVTPGPLAASDPGADVAAVTLTVNGVDIDLSNAEDAQNPGNYDVTISFTDTNLFAKPPIGPIPVVIKATDKRNPSAAVRTLSSTVVVDSVGPVVTVVGPPNGTILGGRISLRFNVKDEAFGSGVDPSTIKVYLNDVANAFTGANPWSVDTSGTYTFVFDSATIVGSEAQVNVSIAASDKAGNPSPGASVAYYIDNQPAIVDMDPGLIHDVDVQGTTTYCSNAYDPLGQAVGDLQSPTSFALLRVFAVDETNSAPGQKIFYPAGIDPNAVRVYVQADTSAPFLVSKAGNGVCDDFANLDQRSPLQFAPVPPAGNADYAASGPVVNNTPDAIEWGALGCQSKNGNPPDPLCTQKVSDLTRVAQATLGGAAAPAVFASGDLKGLECTGQQTELSSIVNQNGWICVAARVVDNVGNVGISAPLRLCLNAPVNGAPPACATTSVQPPDCTTDCTAPPHYYKVAPGYFTTH